MYVAEGKDHHGSKISTVFALVDGKYKYQRVKASMDTIWSEMLQSCKCSLHRGAAFNP